MALASSGVAGRFAMGNIISIDFSKSRVQDGRVRSRSLWRAPDFLKLWTGETVSLLGSQVSLLAIPLAAITVLHASAFQVGALSACETVPFLLVGLPAGVWVDHWRRRPVLITADLGRAVMLGSIPVAYGMGWLSLAQLYTVAILTGVGTVFFDVAYQAYLPRLVGREQLVDGNAKLEISRSGAQIAGPGLAGELIHLLGAANAVAADAISFVVSAIGVGAIRKPEPASSPRPSTRMSDQIREGLGYVLRHPVLRRIAGATGTSNFFSGIMTPVLLLFMVRALHFGPGEIGLVLLLGNLGFLAGAVLAAPVARWLGLGTAIWLSMAVWGLGALLAPLATRTDGFGLLIVSGFVLAVSSPVYNVNQVSLRQAICPDRLQGRMNATMRFLVWGTIPFGGLVGGVLAATIGLRATLWVAAAGGALAFLWVIARPVRSLEKVPSAVPIEDAALGQARQALFDGPSPGATHALDVVEVVDGGPHDLVEAAEAVDDVVYDRIR
jgi:MFS family permease